MIHGQGGFWTTLQHGRWSRTLELSFYIWRPIIRLFMDRDVMFGCRQGDVTVVFLMGLLWLSRFS